MIPRIERGQVDGVPVLRADSATGRCAAAIVFRVGRFDETVPAGGITHLIEHLTVAGDASAGYSFNAAVTGRFTSFVMESSEPSDVTAFLARVCSGLAADHQVRLEQEKRVLRTEASSRGGAGELGSCLIERFGARGPGVVGYEEFGLRRLAWPEIEAWRRRWFTVANAVVWIAGPVPGDLRLELPDGPAPGCPPAQPLDVALPGYRVGGRGGIGLSLAGPRSAGTVAAVNVLRDRLTKELRHARGLSYGIQVAGETLDTETAHTWIAADALPDQISAAAHAMLSCFEALADDGCDAGEIAECARQARDAYASPAGPVAALHRHAEALLLGRPPRQPADLLADLAAVGPTDVAALARELLGQAIVSVPAAVPPVRGRMPCLPVSSATTISGTRYRARVPGHELTVGAEGVMRTMPGDSHATVPADAVAALIRWADGKRAVIGADGFAVLVDPAHWENGTFAGSAIDRFAGRDLAVDIAEPGPAWPAPQPPPPPRPPAPGRAPRRSPSAWTVLRRLLVLWPFLGILGAFRAAQGGAGAGSGFPAALAVIVASGLALGIAALAVLSARHVRGRPARAQRGWPWSSRRRPGRRAG